jgi:hypothetical protein
VKNAPINDQKQQQEYAPPEETEKKALFIRI